MKNLLVLVGLIGIGLLAQYDLWQQPAQAWSPEVRVEREAPLFAGPLVAKAISSTKWPPAGEVKPLVQEPTPAKSVPPATIVSAPVETDIVCDPVTQTCRRVPKQSVLVPPVDPISVSVVDYPVSCRTNVTGELQLSSMAFTDFWPTTVYSSADAPAASGGSSLAARGSRRWFPGKLVGRGICRLLCRRR